MEVNYCRRCGTPLAHQRNHIYKCINDHTIFNNASASVGVFILNQDNDVLMSVRGIEPSKGKLDAFGGFLDGLETAESAIKREMVEETGLTPDQYSQPIYLGTATSEYEFDKENLHVISLLYYIYLRPGAKVQALDDVADIKTIPLDKIPLGELHNIDIEVGVKLLQERLNLLN